MPESCSVCGIEIPENEARHDAKFRPVCENCWHNEGFTFHTKEAYPTGSHWDWNLKYAGKPIICIDFDHTITTKCIACEQEGKHLVLQPGAKEAIIELHKDFFILVFTGRGGASKEIEEFLKANDIPFDMVRTDKPPSVFIIDDRAIHHRSWTTTMEELTDRVRRR